MINNYDKIAPYYDRLSRLVFFKSQVKAQVDQLKYIPKKSSILIVGGGTGWILEEIANLQPAELTITYVEISAQMLSLSKKRNCKNNLVTFIHASVEDYLFEIEYDVILTPFLFDNFSEKQAENVFNKLHATLKPAGQWHIVDFALSKENGRWWKSILLQTMYLFFKCLGIVKVSELVNVSKFFNVDYENIDGHYYYASFIKANIYRKK